MRIVYKGQTNKKKRRWILWICIAAILIGLLASFLFLTRQKKEEHVLPLIEYTEGIRTQTEGKTIRTDEESGWVQCRIDLEVQFYDMSAISLSFTENVWHEVIITDAAGSFLDNEKIRKGELTADIPESARYLVFSLKEDEMSRLCPTGILSEWGRRQKKEKQSDFSGMRLAVMGDSLSAISGFVPSDYWCAYPSEDVSVKEMWWYLAAEELDLEVSTVNACGGSGVSDFSWANEQGMVPEQGRGYELSIWGVVPDMVWVLLGGNDALGGADANTVSENYRELILEIQEAYPETEIFLLTYYPLNASYKDQIEELNQEIRRLAENCGVGILSLENCGITWANTENYRIDDLHPNKEGMEMIAGSLTKEIRRLKDQDGGTTEK